MRTTLCSARKSQKVAKIFRAERYLCFGNVIQFCVAHSVADTVSRQLDAGEFMKVRREYDGEEA